MALFERNGGLKKVFYALRPAMALRWLREHPGAAEAPMHLPTLLAQCDLPADLVAAIAELTDLESKTREMGSAAPPALITAFIDAEFDRATAEFNSRSPRDRTTAMAVTGGFFRAEALR